jgi:hypothetical protein
VLMLQSGHLLTLYCSILYHSDPATFASLILLNRAWRSASEKAELYAIQLSRCASFSTSKNTVPAPSTIKLPNLKGQFVREVKKSLFKVYLRPQQTTINLISTTTSSSAAFPGGEAVDFLFSSRGRWCLALSSSRIFVIDTASPNVEVTREFKVVRRPLSAAILDDGSKLAVFSQSQRLRSDGRAAEVHQIGCARQRAALHHDVAERRGACYGF